MEKQQKFAKYYHLTASYKPKLTFKRNFSLWFQITKGVFKKYIARVLLAVFLLVLVGLVIKFLVPKLPVFENNLVIGVVGEYTQDNLPQALTQLYSSGLTKIQSDGQIAPSLANWKTADGKKFTFILRDNISWHDGKEIKTSDLEFVNLPAEVNVIDEKNIEFILSDAFSPYPASLAKPAFRKNSKVGTGPYKISKLTKNGETLRQIALTPVKNNLPQILINFFPNSHLAVQAFKAGQIGLLFNLPKLNSLENWKGAQILQTFDSTKLVAIFYNTKDELLKNDKVRKALDLSIKREVFKTSVSTSLPPNSWVKAENDIEFDLQKAEKLLKETNIQDSKITVLTPSTFKPVILEIAANWEKLGIRVEIVEIDKIPQDFQAAIFGLEIPADPDQYIFWHSTQSQKLTRIEDPKLDKLLEDGRKALELTERRKIYQEFSKELQSLTPASFLFFQDKYIVINKNSEEQLVKIKQYFPEFPQN